VLLRIPPARRRKRSVNVREVLNGIFLSLLKNELRPIGRDKQKCGLANLTRLDDQSGDAAADSRTQRIAGTRR
jgi:hypothetical protein